MLLTLDPSKSFRKGRAVGTDVGGARGAGRGEAEWGVGAGEAVWQLT